jgi:hypothetical protein
MNYLIYYEGTPFYTNWFDSDNNFIDGMVVFNLLSRQYTINGKNWIDIKQDHL